MDVNPSKESRVDSRLFPEIKRGATKTEYDRSGVSFTLHVKCFISDVHFYKNYTESIF